MMIKWIDGSSLSIACSHKHTTIVSPWRALLSRCCYLGNREGNLLFKWESQRECRSLAPCVSRRVNVCWMLDSGYFLVVVCSDFLTLNDSSLLTATQARTSALPDSIKRVGTTSAFPNEYPGQIYAFNWCLNGDGVTPLRRSAFRITKPLDLQVAGLDLPKKNPLQVLRSS